MLNRFVILVLSLTVLPSVSCVYPGDRPGANEYKVIAKISREDNAERLKRFESLSVDTQIDVYLLAMCCVEPSDLSILSLLENNGPVKIPRILERIKSGTNDRDKMNLIRALVRIDDSCNCVRSDRSIMKVLRATQAQIVDEDDDVTKLYKTSYQEYLNELSKRSMKPK